ncbi:hypothetical protein CVT26_007728 [Gymnopilus dilepis]|uniref:Immunoreactive mannoprotein MP88 n=1 Tax=Gymnopilus dilepis TaxID=231916 RepID=A0A409VZW9_9AGAR|nr:hypothetical protein CVT26_007728 [Gymnopilus dilepis]
MLKCVSILAALVLSAVNSASAAQTSFPPGVLATGTMGTTNPPEPTLGTPINQKSMARLLSVNSVDDFCLFGPPTLQNISDSETIEVAWCTKPRNNARLIPDNTITGVSFLKTVEDFYVQLIGYGDLTKINIPAGDFGGELDPHGAYGTGNPIGGNVTSNITGTDEHYAEWMGNDQFCFRVCTNANSTYSAAEMCWHELDEVGCGFVMPGNYNVNGTFETCDADVAYPPGWYPTATVNGQPEFSTFAQRFTYTPPSGPPVTIGDLTTPAGAYFTPSSSNCVTTSSISNGVNLAALGISGAPAPTSSSGTTGPANKGSSPTGSTTSSTAGPSDTPAGGSNKTNAARGSNVNDQVYPLIALWAFISGASAVILFH